MTTPMVTIEGRRCTVCGQPSSLSIPADKLDEVRRWQRERHTYIQSILPDTSPAEREMLMTGIHPACWEQLFSSDEEEEA